MSSLVCDWNRGLDDARQSVKTHNEDIMRQVSEGLVTAERALSLIVPPPRELPLPSERWAGGFLRTWGWSLLSKNSDSATSLPYEHEDMVISRDAYRGLIDKQGVHAGMILNFDQLWRTSWASGARLLFKAGCAGQQAPRKKAPARASKKIHTVKHVRRSITALTSSWSDGTGGPICFSIPEGRMTHAQMTEWNKTHIGRSYVLSSGTKSHFMSADTLLQVFEQVYSPALQMQREKRPSSLRK